MENAVNAPSMSMNPKKFALWIGIVSMSMTFAALTSAYIVARGESNWLIFDLPNVFFVSTFIILLSSVTMHWAVSAAKNDNITQLKTAILLTTLLGIGFAFSQTTGWSALYESKIYFAGAQSNRAGSFVYVLTLLHLAHIAGGLVILLIALFKSFTFKIHSKRMESIQLTATYWHFVDIVWLYLFVFLLINR